MAVLYTTGFEAGSVAWYNSSAAAWQGNFTINSTAANQHRTSASIGGNYSILLDDNGNCLAGTVPTTARWLHFWGKPNNVGTSQFNVTFAIANTNQFNVAFLNTGVITFYRGATSVGSFTSAFNPNLPHWFAIELSAADVGGFCNVYIDGVLSSATFSGDTKNAASAGWDHFGFGTSFSSTPATAYLTNQGQLIDDIIVTDGSGPTNPLPEHYIVPIVPNGDDSPLQLTSSSGGANYTNVDEIPADDADYNSTTVSGSEDVYTLSNPPTSTSILCANFCARATRDGTLSKGEVLVVSGSTTVYSTPETLPASPGYYGIQYLVENNPDGAVAWDNTSISLVKAGFRATT